MSVSLRAHSFARALSRHSAAGLAAVSLLGAVAGHADEVFDAGGFSANHDTFSQLPYEHIDPMTGNLLLVFTDLVLPGNAGMDLRIQRTYNSKIYKNWPNTTLTEDTWAGIGWTLHMGRIRSPYAAVPGPIEMPDGSQHKLFAHINNSGDFVTRDYWEYDRNTSPPVLRTVDGLIYEFGKALNLGGTDYLYVTEIKDPFNNRIVIQYMTSALDPVDGIASITQYIGNRTRSVTFTDTGGTNKSLSSMTYNGNTWQYVQGNSNSAGYSLLTSARPPVGPAWGYQYRTSGTPRNELLGVTTPNGGQINYSYDTKAFYLGSTIAVNSRAVTNRSTSGRDIMAGTTTFLYSQGTDKNQSIITSPCKKVVYTFFGIGDDPTPQPVWKIGLTAQKQVFEGSTLFQSETFTWGPSVNISNATETVGNHTDVGIAVPLIENRTVMRSPRSYSTDYTYRSTNYNDYGNPETITETGKLSRTTTRTYTYGFTPYLVGRVGHRPYRCQESRRM
jgi:hypothetical protein